MARAVLLALSVARADAQEAPLSQADAPAGAATPAPELLAHVQQRAGRLAWGMYMAGSKVGWMTGEWSVDLTGAEPLAVFTGEMAFAERNDEELSASSTRSTQQFALQGDGPLVAFVEHETEDGLSVVTSGELDGDAFEIVRRTGTRIEMRRVSAPRISLADSARQVAWLAGPPLEGDTLRTYELDLDIAGADSEITWTYVARRDVEVNGDIRHEHDLLMNTQGLSTRATLLDNGLLVRASFQRFVELRPETEAMAIRAGPAIGLLRAMRIPADRALADVDSIRSLVLELPASSGLSIPDTLQQRVIERRDDTIRVRIDARLRADGAAALDPAERSRLLAATPSLQVDAPRIVALAAELTVGRQTPRTRAWSLAEWVRQEVEHSYSANASTALDVLDRRRGDCSEHALLFVALARAAGLPAQQVIGLVYVNDGEPGFTGHAWAAVHDGEHWFSVDPTWGEIPVSPLHLQLAVDGDYGALAFLGAKSIRIVGVVDRLGVDRLGSERAGDGDPPPDSR